MAERMPAGQPPITGERTWPGIASENYWFRRHEAGYRWAAGLGVSGTVVEAGVGEGYGATLLARSGGELVVGVDLDPGTLQHVAARHRRVHAVRANVVALPLRDRSADLVVSAQTVEHLWDQDGFVAECARVLRPGGRLVLTTPNRRTFPPGNPFHHRELDATELRAVVEAHLHVETMQGLHHSRRLVEAGDVVAQQLDGAADTWHPELADLVRSVTVDDFVAGGTDESLDLLLVATRR